MRDFLDSLLTRSSTAEPVLQPRVPSRFEPASPQSSTSRNTPPAEALDPYVALGENDTSWPSSMSSPGVVMATPVAHYPVGVSPIPVVPTKDGAHESFDGDVWREKQADWGRLNPVAEGRLPSTLSEMIGIATIRDIRPGPVAGALEGSASLDGRSSASDAVESRVTSTTLAALGSPRSGGPHDLPILPSYEESATPAKAPKLWPDTSAMSQVTAPPRIVPEELPSHSRSPSPVPPTVNVTIGRVEVRAARDETPAPRRAEVAKARVMTLEQYLQRRAAGGAG